MTVRRSAGLTAAAAALSVVVLTGCGTQHQLSNSPTPTATSARPTAVPSASELVTTMRKTANAWTSFAVSGDITVDDSELAIGSGDQSSASALSSASPPASALHFSLDVAGQVDGSNLSLTGTQGTKTSVTLIIGDQQYLRGNAAFLSDYGWFAYAPADDETLSSPTDFTQYAGKWISSDVPDDASASHERSTLKTLLTQTVSAEKLPDSQVAELTVTPVTDGGVAAYQLKDAATTLIVSADGQATLRYLISSDDGTHQKLRFSQWNAVPPVAAPAGAIPSSQIKNWPFDGVGSTFVSAGDSTDRDYADYTADGSTGTGATSSASATAGQ